MRNNIKKLVVGALVSLSMVCGMSSIAYATSPTKTGKITDQEELEEIKPLEIKESGYSILEMEDTYVVSYGIIINNPNIDYYAYNPVIKITAIGEEEKELDSVRAKLIRINSYREMGYSSQAFELKEKPVSVKFEVEKTDWYGGGCGDLGLTATKIKWSHEVDSKVQTLSGTIENETENEYGKTAINVIFRNDENKIVGGTLSYIDKIEANGQTEFSDIMVDSNIITDNYTIYFNYWGNKTYKDDLDYERVDQTEVVDGSVKPYEIPACLALRKREKPEEGTSKEDTPLKVDTNDAFSKIMYSYGECETEYKEYFESILDKEVEFEGYISSIKNHQSSSKADFETRYDIEIRFGTEEDKHQYGPAIKFTNVSMYDLTSKDEVVLKEKDAIRYTGIVKGYDEKEQFLSLQTKSINMLDQKKNEGKEDEEDLIYYAPEINTIETNEETEDKKQKITVIGRSYDEAYNTKKQEVEGMVNELEKQGIEVSYKDTIYYVKGLSSNASGTKTSDSIESIEVSGEPKVYNEKGKEVTDQFEVNVVSGKFTIHKANLFLHANGYSGTYDGQEHVASGFKEDTTNGTIVEFENGKYTISGLKSEKKGKNVADSQAEIPVSGEAKVEDSKKEDITSEFNVVVKQEGFIIEKASVTLSSPDISKEYDGKALKYEKDTLEEKGWVGEEGATYKFTASQTLPGTTENTFEYTLKEGTSAENYNISQNFGEITVKDCKTKLVAKVKAKSGEFTYDGKEHTVSGFENETDKGIKVDVNGATFYVTGLTSARKEKNVSENISIKIEGTAVVKDEKGNDVSKQFDVETESGKIIIKKAKVTLKSASKKGNTSDGTVTAHSMETNSGWANGEGVDITYTGEQSSEGSSDNTFEYTFKDNTSESNYDITVIYGRLEAYIDNSNTPVIITSGECYHYSSCHTLKKNRTQVTLQDAVNWGYRPCNICNAPTLKNGQ